MKTKKSGHPPAESRMTNHMTVIVTLREALREIREILTQSELQCKHPDEAERLTPDSEAFIGLCSGDDCIYCACLHIIDARLAA